MVNKSNLSFKLRQNAPQQSRKESRRDSTKRSVKAAPLPASSKEKRQADGSPGITFPGSDTAFKTLLSARFCAAVWSHISDCDETYNYWEPMHFLVFGKGLQTWEYSPQFALRSYFYLMFHAVPIWIYQKLLQPNPLLMFYFTRGLLGILCASTEVYFYKAVCKEFGVHVARISLAFQLFSAGMFVSSTAFLPSTFAMYMSTAAFAAWWQQKYPLAVLFTALSSLLGWPFAALLGVPIAFDMIFRKKAYLDFVLWSAISAATVLIPMILIDSYMYGRLVIAPLNIIKYNIFSNAGPDLYGTEPFSYYFINGFLNFNFVWVLALFCPVALVLNYFFIPSKNKSTLNLPYWLSLSPLYLWLAVFMVQSHKEERFLFPVYPMICLCGAISIDVIQRLCFRVWHLLKKNPAGTHYLDKTTFIMIITVVVTALLGVSRIFALYFNYYAPFHLMMELNRLPSDGKISSQAQINVCWGKDWYRYPSSFFLPNDNWSVHFIKSEFSGMLPAPYSTGDNATSIVHPHFNDMNREEPSLYFNISKCNFLLDLDVQRETSLEPRYVNMKDMWRVVKSYPFLDVQSSNKIFRAFYVPFLNNRYVKYRNFVLLKNIKLKLK